MLHVALLAKLAEKRDVGGHKPNREDAHHKKGTCQGWRTPRGACIARGSHES